MFIAIEAVARSAQNTNIVKDPNYRNKIAEAANQLGVRVIFPLDIVDFNNKFAPLMVKFLGNWVIVDGPANDKTPEGKNAFNAAQELSMKFPEMFCYNGTKFTRGQTAAKIFRNLQFTPLRQYERCKEAYEPLFRLHYSMRQLNDIRNKRAEKQNK